MRVDVINHIEGIDSAQWNALAKSNATHTVFQTHEFNCAAQHVYGSKEGSFIVCVKDNDEIVGIFPLKLTQLGNKRILQFLAGNRSDYCDIICPRRGNEAIKLLWDYIFSRRKEWDCIDLMNVPISCELAQYIRENKILKSVSHRISQDEAVYFRFKENITQTQEILHKKKVLAYRNYFKANGKYEVRHLVNRTDISGHLEQFFAQHIERWQNTHSPSLFMDELNKEFYRQLVQILPQGWITLTVIKFDPQVLGYHFGFSYGNKFIWYKPSYNLEFSSRSPGQVLLQEVMEYAHIKGFDEFDFGVGKEQYKYRFSRQVHRNNSFKIFSSKPTYLFYYFPLAMRWRLDQIKAVWPH